MEVLKILQTHYREGRKVKKKLLIGLIVLALLAVPVFVGACEEEETTTPTQPTTPPGEEEVEPVTLKLASSLPPEDIVVVKAQEMADRISERTDGKFIIDVYPGGSLCSMEETFSMLRTGAIDMAESPIEYQTGDDMRFGAVTLPFLVDSLEANVEFLRLINESLFNDIIAEKFNAMPVIVMSTGIHTYCGATKPVETQEDWEGLLVWVANAAEADTVEALGASPVPLPFFDGYPAIEKGVVDAGVGVNPTGVWNFHWYEAIRYITVANMFATSGYIYINLDSVNALSDDFQEILLEECQRCENELNDYLADYAANSLVELENAGVEVYYLPAAERARWSEASSSVIDDFYAQIGEEDAQKIRDAAEEANQ
jgi:TRAP-type C4-dicarboxylate transport system substrate-binding protein